MNTTIDITLLEDCWIKAHKGLAFDRRFVIRLPRWMHKENLVTSNWHEAYDALEMLGFIELVDSVYGDDYNRGYRIYRFTRYGFEHCIMAGY